MGDADEHDDCMVRRGRAPSFSPARARARSSGARSSGAQRPRPPEAGASSGPPGKTPSARAPPRMGLLRRNPLQDDPHHEEEHSDGQLQRLKGWGKPGLAWQQVLAETVQYWLDRNWTEHQLRHWYSLRQVKRNGDGTIIR
eukprot:3100061-Pyramimonas_sp.AAC.1